VNRYLVLKFGGTSLGRPAHIRRAAWRVAAHVRSGRQVVVVVSAAGDATDRVLKQFEALGRGAPGAARTALRSSCGRELDRALATGEDRSAALLAAALAWRGIPARSLRGGEAGLRATGTFGSGRIDHVAPQRLRSLLSRGIVPVVSGFQGTRTDGETLTLGRGGSDVSAVVIAATFAASCHIITDVAAVHDCDPNVHTAARPLRTLSHSELLALAESGANVVHPSAARLALEAGIPVHIYHYRAPVRARGTTVGSGHATQGGRPAHHAAAGGGG
jgi:aspartate kinase